MYVVSVPTLTYGRACSPSTSPLSAPFPSSLSSLSFPQARLSLFLSLPAPPTVTISFFHPDRELPTPNPTRINYCMPVFDRILYPVGTRKKNRKKAGIRARPISWTSSRKPLGRIWSNYRAIDQWVAGIRTIVDECSVHTREVSLHQGNGQGGHGPTLGTSISGRGLCFDLQVMPLPDVEKLQGAHPSYNNNYPLASPPVTTDLSSGYMKPNKKVEGVVVEEEALEVEEGPGEGVIVEVEDAELRQGVFDAKPLAVGVVGLAKKRRMLWALIEALKDRVTRVSGGSAEEESMKVRERDERKGSGRKMMTLMMEGREGRCWRQRAVNRAIRGRIGRCERVIP
ncbi:hypothetical protein ACLOJK_001371 [Asimina triloba]